MTDRNLEPHRVSTVAEAKARLPEVLRQRMGQWLAANMPRGANLDASGSRESRREVPFVSEPGADVTNPWSTIEASEESEDNDE